MKNRFNKVIAIDGPAGSGKSTIAKIVAKKLGTVYIDTGAMYRAVTLKAIKKKIDLKNLDFLREIINNTDIDIRRNKEGNMKIYLDGEDVTNNLRIREINKNISEISKNRNIRERMVELQRELGKNGAVVEGRDISTVVFPKAFKKFYLDAHLEERIRRRYEQAKNEGRKVSYDDVKEEVINRDRSDRTRKVAPLRIAPDADYIDTTNLSIDEVVEKLLKIIKNQK